MTTLALGIPLAPDPALPQRDTMFDLDAMSEAFAAHAGVCGPLHVDRLERRRVKYRFGESLRTVHRVTIGGRTWFVASRMAASTNVPFPSEAPACVVPCDPLRGCWHDPVSRSIFWTFPNDRRHAWVASVCAENPVLARAFPDRALSVSVQSLSPERAVIARVCAADSDRPIAYLKAYAPGTGSVARAVLETIERTNPVWRDGGLGPRLLGFDETGDVLLIEPVAGSHLGALADNEMDPAFFALGRETARLHRLAPSQVLPSFDHFSQGHLATAARQLAEARPDVAVQARRAARALDERRPSAGEAVWLHGDLNALNWLFDGRSVRLIDLDQSRSGPAAADLGGVLGWLRARRLEGLWTPGRERDLQRAFLQGYASIRPLPALATLAWYRAAALLVERALRAVTRLRLRQLGVLHMLVDAASDFEEPAVA